MLLFKRVDALQKHLSNLHNQSKTIGFVPTMGALHEGHLSLVRRANNETDCVVCSIFVNPTQFNEVTDLENYPQTPGKDTALLLEVGCDILFFPPVEEVYPPGLNFDFQFDFEGLDLPMEGEHRPGHFNGVAQVVKRLLDLVKPHQLYMGQKDFQQLAIVQKMLQLTDSSTELTMCPIIREPDGLAMSSRNIRLTPVFRQLAPIIHDTLQEAKQNMHAFFPHEIQKRAMERLSAAGFRPEYFDIVDGRMLTPLKVLEDTDLAVICTAVWAGEVRLIDNIILKQ